MPMRRGTSGHAVPQLRFILATLLALLVSACDLWPRELEPLAESIAGRVSGATTAWLVGGDVVLIDVEGSPLFTEPRQILESTASDLAREAIAFTAGPLESIVITFHAGEVSDDPDRTREFIFLVLEGRPVLQPPLDFGATGPLTPEEVEAAVHRLGEGVAGERRACVLGEAQRRARAAGDPETLDRGSVESLRTMPAGTWDALDGGSRRLFLAQMITTEALFDCVGRGSG
jgi:hypothetical protein